MIKHRVFKGQNKTFFLLFINKRLYVPTNRILIGTLYIIQQITITPKTHINSHNNHTQ